MLNDVDKTHLILTIAQPCPRYHYEARGWHPDYEHESRCIQDVDGIWWMTSMAEEKQNVN